LNRISFSFIKEGDNTRLKIENNIKQQGLLGLPKPLATIGFCDTPGRTESGGFQQFRVYKFELTGFIPPSFLINLGH